MSIRHRTQSERLDFRTSPENKSLIEQAASLQGQSVSSFANAVLVKAADDIVRSQAARVLSERDAHTFMSMLSRDAEPNVALKAAAKRYKERRER